LPRLFSEARSNNLRRLPATRNREFPLGDKEEDRALLGSAPIVCEALMRRSNDGHQNPVF
jgi:hypothetical protein